MAGIGFVLRKLAGRDDLTGILKGYLFAAVVAAGPWLLTILTLGAIVGLGSYFVNWRELSGFRVLIIYNFGFSLVFSAPIFMVATRFLADLIYAKEVSRAPGLLVGAMGLIFLLELPAAAWFYFGYVELDGLTRAGGFVNFFLISAIWLVSIFLSALKNYLAITTAFASGMAISVLGSIFLAAKWGSGGMMLGFNLGLAVIVFGLAARVFAEYPFRILNPLALLPYFRKYWELALSGLFYNLAIWADKWVMWFAPEGGMHPSGLISYPDYDTAMFLAYLVIVPAMAFFLFNVETRFFERYLAFFRDIQDHVAYRRIESNHKALIRVLLQGGRNLAVLQGSLCALAILLAPTLFSLLQAGPLQIGMFRFGVLGALFQVMALFLTVVLSYFDSRRVALAIHLFFLLANAGLTWLSLYFGFVWYGFGYFLASLATFYVAFMATMHVMNDLPYEAFIRHNESVK